MNKQEQTKYDQMLVKTLTDEYQRVKGIVDCLHNNIDSLDFEDRVPDSHERYLMADRLQVTEQYMSNLRNRIRFYRNRVKGAEQSSQVCGCGIATVSVQDPNESQPVDIPVSIRDLVGMTVAAVNDIKCSECVCGNDRTPSGYPYGCVKVELVGGYYLCLAPLHNSIVTE